MGNFKSLRIFTHFIGTFAYITNKLKNTVKKLDIVSNTPYNKTTRLLQRWE